eukprot:Hpha_TRINITY_DN15226_c0_g1::TRINITY_DN15226_c0_g1_i1::g.65486::m.65486
MADGEGCIEFRVRAARDQLSGLQLARKYAQSLGVAHRAQFLIDFFADPANGFGITPPVPTDPSATQTSPASPLCLPHSQVPHCHLARPQERHSPRRRRRDGGEGDTEGMEEANRGRGEEPVWQLPPRPESRRGRAQGAVRGESPLPDAPHAGSDSEDVQCDTQPEAEGGAEVLRCVGVPSAPAPPHGEGGPHGDGSADPTAGAVLEMIGHLALHAARTQGAPVTPTSPDPQPTHRPTPSHADPVSGMVGAAASPSLSGSSRGNRVFTAGKLRAAVARAEGLLRARYPAWGGVGADPQLQADLQVLLRPFEGGDVVSYRDELMRQLGEIMGNKAARARAGPQPAA